MHKTTESPSFSASCRIEGKTPFIEYCEKDYDFCLSIFINLQVHILY